MRQIHTLDSSQWLLAAITFISSLGIAVMLPLIPLYAVSLGATPTQLGLLTSAFALANAAGRFAAGMLMDRAGPLTPSIAVALAGASLLLLPSHPKGE